MMHRIDQAHSQPASPHPVQIPPDKLALLLDMLQQRDLGLHEFVTQVAAYPELRRRILVAANSAATGRSVDISDPVHAAAYLGSRRLIGILRSFEDASQQMAPQPDAA